MPSSRDPSKRDQRLDFWRGLCLVDMVLVHLYYQNVQFGDFLGQLFGNYTRFAAGGFIFISGLSIGVIFLPRAADIKRRAATYRKLWRRSLYILAIHFVSAIVLVPILLMRDKFPTYTGPLSTLRDIFLLKDGGDLLPFYVMMVALSPFLIMAVRIPWGWLAVLCGSIATFIWGLWHPWALAPAQHQTFPPILWQGIFIPGFLLGFAWPRYNALAKGWKISLAAATCVFAAWMFVMEYSWQWSPNLAWLSFGAWFVKVPLSTPEALRYLSIILAIIFTTNLLWPLMADLSAVAFVQTLGRKSLPVYVAHLWLMEAMGALAAKWAWMGSWQILFAVFSVLVLWLFALILDISGKPKQKARVVVSRPQIFGPEPVAGAAQ
jgi:hypothetical protein